MCSPEAHPGHLPWWAFVYLSLSPASSSTDPSGRYGARHLQLAVSNPGAGHGSTRQFELLHAVSDSNVRAIAISFMVAIMGFRLFGAYQRTSPINLVGIQVIGNCMSSQEPGHNVSSASFVLTTSTVGVFGHLRRRWHVL